MQTLRTMMREELHELERSMRFDASLSKMHSELIAERTARVQLEEKVARLENARQTSPDMNESDNSIAVIGGFGEKEAGEAETLIKDALADIDGLSDVYTKPVSSRCICSVY